jgi:hypothetical protein
MHYILGGTKVAKMPKAGTTKAAPVKQTFSSRPATGSTAASGGVKKIGGGNTSAASTA